MRSRFLIWLLSSSMLLALAACIGPRDKQRASEPAGERGAATEVHLSPAADAVAPALLSALPAAAPAPVLRTPSRAGSSSLRLENTATPLCQLVRRPTALLLENALLDTAQPLALSIPDHLRASGDPGAYIVQSRAPLDDAFRIRLRAAGAAMIAYIPNQAYLVGAPAAVAQRLQADPQVQAVLPYEPYFKLKPPLLALALERQALPEAQPLHLTLFPDSAAEVLDQLRDLGVEAVGDGPSPFGPVLWVRGRRADSSTGASDLLPALARLPGVQQVELARARVAANDLGRCEVAAAADAITPVNYLELTGSNVLVGVADFGVDANHPDLAGRVLCDAPVSGIDTNGHGTHVAGIIAGSGLQSPTVTQASGSVMPGTNLQFRGQAPAAQVLALTAQAGPASDAYLQQTAARHGAFISNHSWHYAGDPSYDLAAARYDAAVRDALPGEPGAQPLLLVFGAGNAGNGSEDGTGGDADAIQSPATAKNVITVGAVAQARQIAAQAWECGVVNETNHCQTNSPWLGQTLTNNVMAVFSSRGNVGVGLEGAFGRVKPDIVAPGVFVVSARSTQWDSGAYYGPPAGSNNYSAVLSNLNETLGPFYRYESGTSLAAARVSGSLALMQEFFLRLGRTNSPALMKALLINGARPLATPGAFSPHMPTNASGWGLINLTNSLPPALSNAFAGVAAPMHVFDQDPANALATGQRHTRFLSLSSPATNAPLRITLVWTDPPGNPAASLKLVNDLDLIVTNLDTGEVYLGNDIPPGGSVNQAWNPAQPPNADVVNNVENVYLPPQVGASYSVTVSARAVNVNAVSARTNGVVQDYALVIASGDGAEADALTVTDTPLVSEDSPRVMVVTNSFEPGQGISGGLLLNQRAGAMGPQADDRSIPWAGGASGEIGVGLTNQWRFYVLTNEQNYPHAAFLTFMAADLSPSLPGLFQTNLNPAAPAEADIDLYVSTDSALTNLGSAALAAAHKALGRGGTHAIVLGNAAPGALYYVGVKAESQLAAEYMFMGVFSQQPFGEPDANGSWLLRGINLPATIPAGAAARPGVANVIAVAPAPVAVRRVVVTNELWQAGFTNLICALRHGSKTAVLHNRSQPPGEPPPHEYTWVYEDNGESDILGAVPTDGPGSLRDFIGEPGRGIWLLNLANYEPGQTGLVQNLAIRLDPQNAEAGTPFTVPAHAFAGDFLEIPLGATNLTLCLYNDTPEPLPLEVYLRAGGVPSQTVFDRRLLADAATTCWSFTPYTLPPLVPGRYYIGVFNTNALPQTLRLESSVGVDPGGGEPVISTGPGAVSLPDDALTNACLFLSDTRPIAAIEVALLATNHSRISDMVFTLISPAGTRVRLFDGRGGDTADELGGIVLRTNIYPTFYSGDYNANRTNLFVGYNPGILTIDYDFYAAPDTLHVYYGQELIYESGLVSDTNLVVIPFGPGVQTNLATELVIVMNEGNNEDTNTLWQYTATVASWGPGYVVFTEDTNRTQVPIKFARPPYLPEESSWDFYCRPEQSLSALIGERAGGTWQLEMWDSRAGAGLPAPELASWQLRIVFQNTEPVPVELPPGIARANTVPPGQVAPFAVQAPDWATRATNLLVQASGPVNVLFNQNRPPTGTNAGDITLLAEATEGFHTLNMDGLPPLAPGMRYYLGLQNPGSNDVSAALRVDFDLIPLANGVPFNAIHAGNLLPQYFAYDVSSNATAVSFQLLNPEGNLNLVVRRGGALPTLAGFDYGSFCPGTNSEGIFVFPNTAPVALAPGRWHLGVFNADLKNVAYTIRATEYTNAFPNVVRLNNGEPYYGYNSGGEGTANYYHFVVSTNAVRAQFEIIGPAADMTLLARKGLPLPNAGSYDCRSANPGLNDELITLFDFSSPVSLTPGDWFIAAVNASGEPADYAITATEFQVYGLDLLITECLVDSYNFCLGWTSMRGLHYYVEGKADLDSTNWVVISPTLTASGNAAWYCVEMPSPYHFFRIGEGLVLEDYGAPVAISRIAVEANGVYLEWTASVRDQFQVQWTPSLSPPDWTPFAEVLTSVNGTFEFRDDGSQTGGLSSPRYYRLRRLP